jgi:uncharacterized protein (TIGR00725 family)
MKVRVGVIGASQAGARESRRAYEVGQHIARSGAVLICGGLGGVMKEAARGAYDEGGLTVGILPGDDASHANPYIHIPIVTGMSYARNIIVVRSSQVVIAIGGAYGTLSEIAYALNLGVPLVGLGTWSIAKIDRTGTRMALAETAGEAVATAFNLINPKSQIRKPKK